MTEQGETGLKLPPVHQLGYVVSDIEKTCRYYESTFGMGPFSEVIDVDMDGAFLRGKPVKTKIKVAFAQSGDVQVEFIQPVEGENVYTEFLASKGDGIHHLAFQVDDMDAIKAEFAKKGF
ncbi:MAG: VOC family protein, partial [Deltaproteobacteria bacterium]|nr:VOC family protein [Deltaproteobacteria bacterium]